MVETFGVNNVRVTSHCKPFNSKAGLRHRNDKSQPGDQPTSFRSRFSVSGPWSLEASLHFQCQWLCVVAEPYFPTAINIQAVGTSTLRFQKLISPSSFLWDYWENKLYANLPDGVIKLVTPIAGNSPTDDRAGNDHCARLSLACWKDVYSCRVVFSPRTNVDGGCGKVWWGYVVMLLKCSILTQCYRITEKIAWIMHADNPCCWHATWFGVAIKAETWWPE